jgi:hypothetical protein
MEERAGGEEVRMMPGKILREISCNTISYSSLLQRRLTTVLRCTLAKTIHRFIVEFLGARGYG